mgnify:CR=1 FL=1
MTTLPPGILAIAWRISLIDSNDSRTNHYLSFSGTSDLMTIGRGLQILSGDHFSMSSYYMSEGQYLSLDENKELKSYYNSSDHPYSLEPEKNEKIQGMSGLDMIEDIHEQDYYKKNNLGGVILGISGGKDSGVVAGLFTKALGKENVIGVTMPCHSKDEDKIYAKLIFDISLKTIEISQRSSFDEIAIMSSSM